MKRLIPMLILCGCAHQVMPGTVTHALTPSEAEVYSGREPMRVGEPVGVFKKYCNSVSSPEHGPSCRKVRLGHGRVKANRKNYSIIELDRGTVLDRGSFVEQE